MKSNNRILFLLITIFLSHFVVAQKTVNLMPGEYWWGGQIAEAAAMPFDEGYTTDLSDNLDNQTQPLLLSNKGRYIWNSRPFSIKMDNLKMTLSGADGFVVGQAGETLADAYKYAVENFFDFKGINPDDALFKNPQYNTQLELGKGLSQSSLLSYAQSIIDKDFPAGVIVVGDNWQKDIGDWNFDPGKFQDAKAMIDLLHEMGFKVMLTVNPFVSPDSENFRMLHNTQNAFLKDPLDPEEPKIVKWTKGYSALLDLSNTNANIWFKEELKQLQKIYGIDGFKFDGGDFKYYDDVISNEDLSPAEHCALYSKIGESFRLNEYSAAWKMGGAPLTQTLSSTGADWRHLPFLIPSITVQGLMGYPYITAEMMSEDYLPTDSLDQELLVRYAQAQALLPSMQIPIAPWRVLDDAHLSAFAKAANLHSQFGSYITKVAGTSATSGAPMAQSMEYAYPNEGLEFKTDQFMLGNDLLVAPILEKGARSRSVWLPEGIWLSNGGKAFKGPVEVTVDAPIDVLPYFRRGQVNAASTDK